MLQGNGVTREKLLVNQYGARRWVMFMDSTKEVNDEGERGPVRNLKICLAL